MWTKKTDQLFRGFEDQDGVSAGEDDDEVPRRCGFVQMAASTGSCHRSGRRNEHMA